VHAKALAEDPTIFDYDTAHDLMQEHQRTAIGPAAAFTGGGHSTTTTTSSSGGGSKAAGAAQVRRAWRTCARGGSDARVMPQPKYIGALLQMAADRKREQERVMIRKLQRDRAKEGDEFADKEQFVTAAYVPPPPDTAAHACMHRTFCTHTHIQPHVRSPRCRCLSWMHVDVPRGADTALSGHGAARSGTRRSCWRSSGWPSWSAPVTVRARLLAHHPASTPVVP
jgi:hypothetical protein